MACMTVRRVQVPETSWHKVPKATVDILLGTRDHDPKGPKYPTTRLPGFYLKKCLYGVG